MNCAIGHPLYRCSKFRSLPTKSKWDAVYQHKICCKCLGTGHTKNVCTSNFVCRSCDGDHHTLLHKENQNLKTALVNESTEEQFNKCVLLSTAVVSVKNGKDQWVNCRVLLDSGSQVSLVTKSFKDKLMLEGRKARGEIEGVSENRSKIEEKVGMRLRSKTSKYSTFVDALVIQTILSNVPHRKVMAGRK